MKSIPALAEPDVLRWAREQAGLTPVAAARKITVPDERVSEWEDGTTQPTIAQLRKAATVYKRALSVFFLSAPPSQFDTLRDFRRLAGSESGAWSPALHDEYRRAHTQREFLLELAELDEDPPATDWQVSIAGDDRALASRAREALLAKTPLSLPRSGGSPYEHLNVWISALEQSGALIAASRGGKVAVSEMRAFSLYFDVLPVIVVNGSDSPRGRLFSLLHEYAHLLIHTGGICDAISDRKAVTPNRRIEARCNAIAADVLMPAELVRHHPVVQAQGANSTEWDYPTLAPVAAAFGVSAEAFLRRLHTLGYVTREFYEKQRELFAAALDDDGLNLKPSMGNWYRTTVRDLGKGYVRRVADAHRRRVIDSNTAAVYLDVKVSQIPRLAETAGIGTAV